jgi:DNA-binding response OmpR family regulator
LRRTGATPIAPFAFGVWRVDPATRSAARDGTTIELSAREVELLALFAREPGRIVSRRRLLVELWGLQHVDGITTRTVDVHIAKLRKKIGAGDCESIETVRGEGYRFVG